MDTAQDYLYNRLKTCSYYSLTELDNLEINKGGVEAYIIKKLTSKKFRRTKLPPLCEERIKKAVHQAITNNKPIQIVFPAGAYKLWSLPSFPEADWAEFFNIAHVLNYLAPIAGIHKPGVQLSYYLFTYLMQKSNNISALEVNSYIQSFQTIINEFLKHTPQNMQIKIVTDADFYEREKYYSVLENSTNKAIEIWKGFTPEKKEHYLKSSRLNVRWKGEEDWTTLSDNQKEEKIMQGALYEVKGNIDFFPKISEWVFGGDKIIVFPQMKNEFLGIGSTKNSVTKYWTGFGVLEKRNEQYEARILSPSQFERVKQLPHEVLFSQLIPLKNLKELWVYNNPLFPS